MYLLLCGECSTLLIRLLACQSWLAVTGIILQKNVDYMCISMWLGLHASTRWRTRPSKGLVGDTPCLQRLPEQKKKRIENDRRCYTLWSRLAEINSVNLYGITFLIRMLELLWKCLKMERTITLHCNSKLRRFIAQRCWIISSDWSDGLNEWY